MADRKRDELEVDVVCVGAGVASIATAIQLMNKVASEAADTDPPTILILEKGLQLGSHILSGAVIDPAPFARLLGEKKAGEMPIADIVREEKFCMLMKNRTFSLPFTPPPMSARDCSIVSLSNVVKWLGKYCEELGVEIYPEMSAADFIEEEGRITGVRLGDKGIDKSGKPKPNFEPGADIHARMVVLGEGAHGVLTRKLVERASLDGDANEQQYAIGIKELLELPAEASRSGRIMHTFGYPLDWRTYGGGFLYGSDDRHVHLGLVVGLDYRNPHLDPHKLFRALKAHPTIHGIIGDGKVVGYGAKVLPEGGIFSVPRMVTDGALIVGDGAGLLDALRLKGVHLAVESGIAAGNALFECWRDDDWSLEKLKKYPRALKSSPAWKKMQRFRNVRASFQKGGLPLGIASTGLSYLTNGLLPPGRLQPKQDHPVLSADDTVPPDLDRAVEKLGKNLNLDIMTDLYLSGTQHEEDQPSHLVIKNANKCLEECIMKLGAPCTRFCPALVYELNDDGNAINIQASNCLHCKTCAIKCPKENIEWRLPEAGGGPRYRGVM